MIGILGGMGPLATADFFAKLLAATPAACDEDHVPLLIQSDPHIPRRPAAILAGGESPLPALRRGRDRLIAAGVQALAMPCNTAHFWLAELRKNCAVPFLSIVEACSAALPSDLPPNAAIGVIATRATLAAGIFSDHLAAQGFTALNPSEHEMEVLVLPGIALVKQGQTLEAGVLLAQAVERLIARGCCRVILACTEVPMALDAVNSPLRAQCIDSTAALARACVDWWRKNGKLPAEGDQAG